MSTDATPESTDKLKRIPTDVKHYKTPDGWVAKVAFVPSNGSVISKASILVESELKFTDDVLGKFITPNQLRKHARIDVDDIVNKALIDVDERMLNLYKLIYAAKVEQINNEPPLPRKPASKKSKPSSKKV